MSLAGHTTGEISDLLKVHRSTVPLWIEHRNRYGAEGLWEGHRSGRPRRLNTQEREKLCDILDSGPVAYGWETGIWTSPLVRHVIAAEFGQDYHAGHVRQTAQGIGLLGAAAHQSSGTGGFEATAQMGALYLSESKKKAQSEGAVVVFEDEASFRQTPTLHATWAKRGSQPRISGSTSSFNSAAADVYDSRGTEIFKVLRNNRWSESGVTNAVSKEVVKPLLEWQKKNSRTD